MSLQLGKTILVIDDDPASLKPVSLVLTGAGYEVITADSGRSALQIITKLIPDAILLDHEMDDLSGVETCRLIKSDSRFSDVPVLFLSGYNEINCRESAFDVGAVDFIAKPYSNRELLARIKTHVQLSSLQRSLQKQVAQNEEELSIAYRHLETELAEKQNTIAQLEQSEKYVHTILQTSIDGFFIANEQCTYLEVNDAYAEMCGFTIDEIIGMNITDLVVVDSVTMNNCVEKIRGEQQGRYEIVHRRKNGETFPAELSVHYLDSQLICVIRDISERKASEAALMEERLRFKKIFEASPVGLILLDQEVLITGANSALSHLVLCNPAEIIGQRAGNGIACVHSEEDPRGCGFGTTCKSCILRNGIEAVIGNNTYVEGVETLMHLRIENQIQPRWLRIDAKPIELDNGSKVIVAIADITKEKAVEEALYFEHERLLGVIEATQTGTWEWNIITGETVYNERWAEICGYSLSELMPLSVKTWESLVHPDDLKQCHESLEKVFAGELPYYEVECRMLHKNGKWVWVLIRGSVFSWDDQRRPLKMRGSHVDITDRKESELRLIQSAQLLAEMEKLANVGGWELDLSTNELSWSDHIYVIHEVDHSFVPTVETAIGFYTEESRRLISDAVSKAIETGESYDLELEIVTAKGNHRFVHTMGSANLELNRMYGFFQDVTVQKAAELALVEREKFLSAVIETSADAVWMVDTSGGIIQVNHKAVEMYGYSSNEFIGLNVTNLDEFDKTVDVAERIRLIKERGWLQFETKHRNKNRELVDVEVSVAWIDLRGGVMVAFCRDITERKRSEFQLFEKQERLNEAQLIAHLGSWEYDFDRDELTWSDEVYRIFELEPYGFDPSYESFLTHVHPFDRERVDHAFNEAIEQKKNFSITHRILLPTGGVKHVIDKGWIEYSSAGKPVRSVGTVQDITDRVEADAREKSLQNQLYQSQKMEAVGQLAGGVAHDFNNMLGVILGHTDEILFDVQADDPLYESIYEIKRAAQRSAGLTRQLLAFSRQQPMTPKSLDLNDTVEGMLKMLRRLMGETIKIHWEPVTEATPLFMDPGQIDQILANLCVNARDAIAGSGTISIETGNVHIAEPKVLLSDEVSPGDYVTLTVRDSGSGMNENTMKRIFEPFFTTKGIGKGTGLGLATVFGIVHQNSGAIDVESTVGVGSTFTIYLPKKVVVVDTKVQEVSKPSVGGSEKIILVEDEVMLLATSVKVLKRYGYTVFSAGSAEQAVVLAKEHPDCSLLITDVILPESDGNKLSEEIREIIPNIRVLFMSGYTANVISDHGVLDEGVQFLQKPFQFEDLLMSVRNALE